MNTLLIEAADALQAMVDELVASHTVPGTGTLDDADVVLKVESEQDLVNRLREAAMAPAQGPVLTASHVNPLPAQQHPSGLGCGGPLCGLPEHGGNHHPLCNQAQSALELPDPLAILKRLGPKQWETSPEAHAQTRLIVDFEEAYVASKTGAKA